MNQLLESATDLDSKMMRTALLLGEQVRSRTAPNPWVGCVIAQGDVIVGEGQTEPPGGRHAEIVALENAGGCAEGATVYVTLEPCDHYGRTPPCTDALIEAKVARVVIGLTDPDPQVRGQGIETLRAAGIQVDTGIQSEFCFMSLEPYLKHRLTGFPFCILKTAISIDGRIAARDGSSQWISCDDARDDVHMWRDECQAIIVGSGTAMADKPRLTVHRVERTSHKPPLRVLLDRRGRTPATGPLFDTSEAPTLVCTSHEAKESRIKQWEKAGAQVGVVNDGQPFLLTVLQNLGEMGVIQAFVEGGPTLHTEWINHGLCDKLLVYVGPKLLGKHGKPFYLESEINAVDDGPKFYLQHCGKVGQTGVLEYRFDPQLSENNESGEIKEDG